MYVDNLQKKKEIFKNVPESVHVFDNLTNFDVGNQV